MALPNPTVTNYGNVDDITPTEANNIGLNLISLGQKIQAVGDDVWVATNADYVAGQWVRLNVAKAASAVKHGIDGSITFYKVAAGANPIAWTQLASFTAAGVMNLGAVPQLPALGTAPSPPRQTGIVDAELANMAIGKLFASAAGQGYPQSGTGGETLRFIRGLVLAGGGIFAGSGFTVSKPGTGIFTITFQTPFSGVPACLPIMSENTIAYHAVPRAQAAGSFEVRIYGTDHSTLVDNSFSFLAIGPA